MQSISTIGLDIAKSVFQVHGVDAAGQVVMRRQLRHRQDVRRGPRRLRHSVAVAVPKFTKADFMEYRRHRAFDAWKRAMWDAGLKLPTQVADGRSTCFCGAAIDVADVESHVYAAHMESA